MKDPDNLKNCFAEEQNWCSCCGVTVPLPAFNQLYCFTGERKKAELSDLWWYCASVNWRRNTAASSRCRDIMMNSNRMRAVYWWADTDCHHVSIKCVQPYALSIPRRCAVSYRDKAFFWVFLTIVYSVGYGCLMRVNLPDKKNKCEVATKCSTVSRIVLKIWDLSSHSGSLTVPVADQIRWLFRISLSLTGFIFAVRMCTFRLEGNGSSRSAPGSSTPESRAVSCRAQNAAKQQTKHSHCDQDRIVPLI